MPKSPALFALAILLLLGVLTGVPPAAPPAVAQTDPDFTNVADVLQGRRRLLPIDDLVVSSASGQGGAVSNLALLMTNSSVQSQASYQVGAGATSPFATAAGRMLRLPRDVVFTMTENTVTLRDQNPAGQPATWSFPVSGTPAGLTMADFNGDGFADVAILTATAGASSSGLLRIVSANDPGDPDKGLFVSTGVSPQSIDFTRPIAIASGSFYGDGSRQVVVAQPTAANGTQYAIQIYQVQLNADGTFQTQALKPATTTPFIFSSYDNQPLLAFSVLAGNFDASIQPSGGLPQDEIAIVAQAGSRLTIQGLRVQSSAPDATDVTLVSTFVSADTLATSGEFFNPITALAARLDWFSAADQVVVAYTAVTNDVLTSPLAVFVSDSQLNWSRANPGIGAIVGPVVALAAGNYDQSLTQTGPPNLELALVTFNNPSPGFSVAVARVDPSSGYAFTFRSSTPILSGVPAGFGLPVALAAGDLQGRSLLLGPPNKVTITAHQQPQVVLATPPMHVDWIAPDGASEPTVLNVSAVPNGFLASFQTAVTNQAQSSSTSTTSFSYATKQTAQVDVSFGVPEVTSLSASITAAAQKTHDNVVATVFDTYASRGFDASTRTGFDDHLWFSSKRFNIYAYPVIGRCIPCADAGACTPGVEECQDGQAPMIVQFSGPDQIEEYDMDAANVEWYQPIHEVGQVLSYPWSLSQLTAQFPGFLGLNCGDPQCQQSPPPQFFTDSSSTTQETTWNNGASNQQTSGSTSTSSFATNVSVSASVSAVGDFFQVGGGGSLAFGYNTSQSVATLFSSVQQIGQSTGVGIVTPGTFQDPQVYQYAWQPFIFGQAPPDGTIQSLSAGTAVATSGVLRTGFLANPIDPQAGPWWASAYTQPDVALNHPARWEILTLGEETPNCLRVGNTSPVLDCAQFNPPDPGDVTGSPFYWMKGLLITPVAANGTGPQLVQATAGDVLSLQARVYNYSLVDMSPTTQVHVQFYGQPWDTDQNDFAGPSFFIGEQILAPIPGFGNDGGNPNWALAATTFDTTDYPDTDLVFWVVVWMQDANGALVAEIPGHGLTAIPGSDLTSITQVPIEDYSNNVGYYRQVFYIAPPTEQVGAQPGQLAVKDVLASPDRVEPRGRVKVRAGITASGGAADGVTVYFYDGDPDAGGRLFDVELIPHIRVDATYVTQVLYRPAACGPHTLFVVARAAGRAPAAGSTVLEVGDCDVIALTGSATRVGEGTDNGQVRLSGEVAFPPSTSGPDLGRSHVTLQNLLFESGGAGELVDRIAAGSVRLVARPGGDATSAIFESQPGSDRPSFRMAIERRSPGVLEWTLSVDRAVLSHRPSRCSAAAPSTTMLTTSFVVDDGVQPVMAATSLAWDCVGRNRRPPSELRRR